MNSEFTIAVHCLLFLGIREGRIANSEDIAESVSTHPARVRKVLSVLRKHRYVMTKEGAHGGYMLNSKPEEVRLGDLYRLFALGSFGPHWRSGMRTPAAWYLLILRKSWVPYIMMESMWWNNTWTALPLQK